jgi:hypothetical protein
LQSASNLQQSVRAGQNPKLNTYLKLSNHTGSDKYFIIRLYDDKMNPHDSGFFWLPNGKDRSQIIDAVPRFLPDEQAYLIQVVGYGDSWDEPKTWGTAGRISNRILQVKADATEFEASLVLTGGRSNGRKGN